MKYLMMIAITTVCYCANAQSGGGVTGSGNSRTGNTGTNGSASQKKAEKTAAKENVKSDTGVNTHSYMPGSSPVGTGGAGGDNMSGSRKGSALNNKIKQEQPSDKLSETEGTGAGTSESLSGDNQVNDGIQNNSNNGSTLGTGGNGGNTMSGSKQGSADSKSINKNIKIQHTAKGTKSSMKKKTSAPKNP